MYEDVAICPVSNKKGDFLGFKRVVDADSDEEIEKCCQELERFLKEEL